MSRENSSSYRIILASENMHEIRAVRNAAYAFFPKESSVIILGFPTNSGVNAQPIGDETIQGGRNRLQNTYDQYPSNSEYRVAIENGIFLKDPDSESLKHDYEDKAVVIIRDPEGTETMEISEGVLLPSVAVKLARSRGFSSTTVGQIIAELYPGIDPTDPHTFLTQGAKSRQQILTQTVKKTFQQLVDKYNS